MENDHSAIILLSYLRLKARLLILKFLMVVKI